VCYTRSVKEANALIGGLDTSSPVGIDVEWRPTFQKNTPQNKIALIQLANAHRAVLIHLSAMNAFPENLAVLLANPAVSKVGVGMQSDVLRINRDYNTSPIRGCVDLSLLARCVDNARWKGSYKAAIGLRKLVHVYLNKQLTKSNNVILSNWEWNPLTQRQIHCKYNFYSVFGCCHFLHTLTDAAADAYVGYAIYKRLASLPVPASLLSRYYTFDMFAGRLYNPSPDETFNLVPWDSKNPNYISDVILSVESLTTEEQRFVQDRMTKKKGSGLRMDSELGYGLKK
jgi:hypothetical protein